MLTKTSPETCSSLSMAVLGCPLQFWSPVRACPLLSTAVETVIQSGRLALNQPPGDVQFRTTVVGVTGFEPALSTSQTWRDNQASLHPDAETDSTSSQLGRGPSMPANGT